MKILYIAATLMTTFTLASCASTPESSQKNSSANLTTSLIQHAVKQTCQTQLTNHQYWKIATMKLSSESQAKITETACGCVADKAPEAISLTELTTAAINPNARTEVAQKIVRHSLRPCMLETVNTLIMPTTTR
ncbi:hypothetical protein D6D69_03495 [Moraxella catarrhalis]|uniref:hypothetical protein n=1 Tax=Moraxella catarrhalis TaxID=480 RepID=UPI0007E3D147|nr:hypothetical protein [Moraxella catarrhalis]OAV02820.1 putative lipoprotein [Moraxella catarrhalis]OAV07933.1 putative lipoprotein [Moraxella catarrhalis]OAV30577.1 putative lipoprotein [Moraxella catarrhalis]RKM23580.1 hypothetical protein D6D69_03495 [Moraxella catarrhalis]